jgi:hypothetical protein
MNSPDSEAFCRWEAAEVANLLKLAIDLKIVNKMDSKSIKHIDLYQKLAAEHSKTNYNRTSLQIKSKSRSKYKQLRLNYIYLLKELFGDRPRKQLAAYGVDMVEGKYFVYLSRVPKILNIFFTESMCSENIADDDDDNIEVNYSVVPYESVPSTSTSKSKQNKQKNTKYDTPSPSPA